MPPDRAQRVAEIVEAALERETRECRAFVAAECGDDRALRAEVESLLEFRGEAAEFIEAPAIEANARFFAEEADELRAGHAIGAYRIVSLLGEGGMGEVYLAEDTSLGRKVALKLVKRGFGAANFIRQFRHEERILASLNHPNIARLYGGGVTEQGIPYFAMEYVEGQRLDEYCALRQLSISEQLQLFIRICSAVSYAHQNLVIHRDLKPANIRVTAEGEPKLLDFGIAKLLDHETAAAAPQTITMLGVMTPEYASPEQVRGERMTTASDVYSLGVVLYELLSGRKPFRLTSHAPDEISRAITTQVPPRPSQAVAERATQVPPPTTPETRNPKLLKGDLDNIVLMAIRKEPERRYSSVSALAEDIRRHLEGLPVSARRDTLKYRTSKFVQRHKLAVAAVLLVTLSLVGGIFGTTWQARRAEEQRLRAERRFGEVRRLANSLLFELHGAIENLPGATTARHLLVQRALEYLDSLAREASDDVALQRELISAYIKVGNVQGNPNNANLGDTAGALRSYQQALAIAEHLIRVNAADAQAVRQLAVVLEKTSEVRAASGDITAAVATARESLARFQTLADADPESAKAKVSLVIAHQKVGDVLGNPSFPNAGDHAGALENYRRALEILHAAERLDPALAGIRRLRGVMHERVGAILHAQGDIAGAEESYRESQRVRETLAAAQPDDIDIARDVAIAHEKIGNILTAAGDLTAALESRTKALAAFQRLADADPKNVQAQQSLAISHIHFGDLLGAPDEANLGRPAEALVNYRRAIQILQEREKAGMLNARIQATLRDVRERMSQLEGVPQAQ